MKDEYIILITIGGLLVAYPVIELVKFVIDTIKLSNRMKVQGGTRTKYSILIGHILSNPNLKIVGEKTTHVTISTHYSFERYKTKRSIQDKQPFLEFRIEPTLNSLVVRYRVKASPSYGSFSVVWNFPDDMSQEVMIKRIDAIIQNNP